MHVLDALGSVGADFGRAWWWGLLLLTYAAGWVMGVASGVTALTNHLYDGFPGGGNVAPR